MEEKINDEENINNSNENLNNEDKDFENFETDLLKYNFDYTTKFKTCNISEKERKKFLLNIFLMSTKINIFNKIICLNQLYEIYKEENNFQMMYNITYKLISYLKQQRMPNQYVNMNTLFSYEFLCDLQNYYFAYKSLNDIKKLTLKDNIYNYLYKEIKDFVNLKIAAYKSIFHKMLNEERIKSISEIINNIFKENEDKNNEKIKENKKEIKKGNKKENNNKAENNEIKINNNNDNKIESNENKNKENNNIENKDNKNIIFEKKNENKIIESKIIENKIIDNNNIEKNLENKIIENNNENKIIENINENNNENKIIENENKINELNINQKDKNELDKKVININDIENEIKEKEKEKEKEKGINNNNNNEIGKEIIINENDNENRIKSDILEKEKDIKISFDNIKESEKYPQNSGDYLYAINRIWLENAKKFIDNYIFAKETGLLNEFLKDSFDPEYALAAYLIDGKIIGTPKSHNFFPFPGPINNFYLTTFKEQWIDPINIEENDLIRKELVNGKDYFLIKYNEWIILQNAFSFTNILIREKNKIDLVQIGVIIFDQRFKKYKNDNINLLKKKVIQIDKNACIHEFIGKILRAVDYELNKINQIKNLINSKNKKNNEKNDNNKKINENNIPENKNIINEEKENIINDNNENKNNDINNNTNNENEGLIPDIGESFIDQRKLLFYKVNKHNKDIIIEMYICFINDILTYNSVFIKELKFDDNKKIEEIFKNYNPKKELLIIEILDSNTSPKFLNQIKPIQNANKIYNCSICNKIINDLNDSKYTCELCSMYLFCSKECGKNKDTQNGIEHHKLHIYLSELISNKFDLSDFFSKQFYQKIYTDENVDKNKGIIGLFNLGNTCYMNCSLQCLSNTKDLTKYFLYNYFQNEINLENGFGTNGVLTKAYYDLIFNMWLTDLKRLTPYFFRMSFCESTRKFMNNRQQDAMEFISIFLNYLHEDLNRVTDKPYIQIEEQKKNEKDIETSKRYWDCHKLRENSIIVDLFHGQFQNIIKCEKCHIEKKTYEPFINISLSIPEEHNFYIIKFFTHLNCKYITMNINSNTTFGELIKKATNYLSKDIIDALDEIKNNTKNNKKYIEQILVNNIELVKLDKDKIITTIYSQSENEKDIFENYQKKLLKFIGSGEEIVLFERKIIPDYCQNVYVYPIMTDEKDIDKLYFLSYPVVFSVKHNWTLEYIENIIKVKFSHILNDQELNNANNKKHLIDLNILHSSKNINKGLFKIHKEYSKCPFCLESYDSKKYCPLYITLSKTDPISKIFKLSKNSEPFVLLARSKYYDKNKKIYDDFNFEENTLINKHKNIYDSFNIFGKFESLGEKNLWDCPECKQKRIIYKAIRIYKPPNYLILQLKRFKKKSDNFFSFLEEDKNNTFVYFPTKNLDLTNYIDGPEKVNAVYNLYAIINHKSNLGVNHFTAFCRNNNRWLEYDDSKLYNVKDPITKDAYILFYIKKEIDQ